MNKEYLEVKAEDISKLLYEVYDVPSGICEQIKNMQHRLESIDNANPSEALKELEELEKMLNKFVKYKVIDIAFINIKQALLKAQEQEKKPYLKWEDLEFTYEEQAIKVKMGERKYTLVYHKWFMLSKWYYHAELRNEETLEIIHDIREGIFNDLHLERVEE